MGARVVKSNLNHGLAVLATHRHSERTSAFLYDVFMGLWMMGVGIAIGKMTRK